MRDDTRRECETKCTDSKEFSVAMPPQQGWSLQLFDRIFDRICFRKTYHLITGCLLAAGILALDRDWLIILCVVWLVFFGVIGRRVSTAVLGVLLLAILTESKLTTFAAAIVFVVGDGAAAIAGAAFGKMKLPWNRRKSIEGSLAFLVSSSISLFCVLRVLVGQSSPANLALLAVLPALIGCLAEAPPFELVRDIRDGKPDDNLLVLLSSGAVFHWLTGLMQIRTIP